MLEKKGICTPSAGPSQNEETLGHHHATLESSSGERHDLLTSTGLSPSNKSSKSSSSFGHNLGDHSHYHNHTNKGNNDDQDQRHSSSEDNTTNTTTPRMGTTIAPDSIEPDSNININANNKNDHHNEDDDDDPTTALAEYNNVFAHLNDKNYEGSSGGSNCGSVASSSGGKRSKSKESYHSSDEVIDEEDLLAISDSDYVDNDIPIIPGMITTTANTSDVDSAFEDSHYSGSSDDKNRKGGLGGSGGHHHGVKSKSKRKSSGSSRHPVRSGADKNSQIKQQQNTKQRRYENIAEITPGNEDDLGQGEFPGCPLANPIALTNCNPLTGMNTFKERSSSKDGEKDEIRIRNQFPHDLDRDDSFNRDSRSCNMNTNMDMDNHLSYLHHPEQTQFEMDVSPANVTHEIMPMHEGRLDSQPFDPVMGGYHQQMSRDPYHNFNYHQRRRNSVDSVEVDGSGGGGADLDQSNFDDGGNSRNPNDPYTIEEDLDAQGHPTTILLPPLEVQGSPDDDPDTITNLTSPTVRRGSQPGGEYQYLNGSKVSVVISPVGMELENHPKTDGENNAIGGKRERRLEAGHTGSGDNNENRGESGEADEDFDVVYVVPDGGWGWMVLFGSILVNILIPGTVKSFGVLFVEFLEVFNASPAAAAWIPALSYWLYSSMGPFASALAIRFSHRSVTIIGGLLASLGLMLSYFATSIPYLYVSYGIIGGLGAGLAYPMGVFMVGQYFEKRRGLANGLCTSGSALGSVLVPPLLRILLVEYGYRGAILIMGGILLNVCVGAMFYDPIGKHMKKVLVPREKVSAAVIEAEDRNGESQSGVRTPPPVRRVTSPIPRVVNAPIREVAASMPIAIPLPPQNNTEFRDVRDRRGSGSGRRATFQIGHETPQGESWSFKSNEVASPLAARLGKEEHGVGGTGSPKWSLYNPSGVIRVRGHVQYLSNDSNPELETLIHTNSSGMMVTPGGTTLSLSGMGTSRGQSRLNLTAIPEDDDTASESASRQVDWTFYSALPPAKQRLLRLSMGGGTQLMGGSHGGTHSGLVSQTGLSRTMSVASNVSNSSFHYVSTIHHGSLLTAMQYDKNVPEFASTLTLKSVRDSCCPRLTTLKGFCRKLTCGLWPKASEFDEKDQKSFAPSERHVEPKSSKHHDRFKKFIDLSLLRDGIYLIILFSNSTTAVGYTNFIVLLPSYALALGFDKSEAAFLLSVVAALDFVGRIGGAALSDLQFISRKWFYIVGLFGSGVALAILPVARTYSALVGFCAVFGLFSGIYIGVTAVILADQLGAEKLGSSYGISLFLNGLLQLVGPPICGVLLQEIGRLEPILTGLGVTLIIGAMLWIFAPFIERHRAMKAKAEAEARDEDRVGDRPINTIGAGETPLVLMNGRKSATSLV